MREDPAGTQPERLLLLDTPDVDGTLKENWRLAEIVRHAADVLVCVLTQQKYNDAAIRDFFRPAAEVDKTVLVVFNMVNQPDTPRQREVVGGWLKTFCAQTGVEPMHVYIAPWDEPAVEANRLPFYPLTPGATTPRQDLAELQFDAIKIRSFRGSLRGVLDSATGLPAYLASVRNRSREYAQAGESLCRMNYTDRLDLPPFPPRLLDERDLELACAAPHAIRPFRAWCVCRRLDGVGQGRSQTASRRDATHRRAAAATGAGRRAAVSPARTRLPADRRGPMARPIERLSPRRQRIAESRARAGAELRRSAESVRRIGSRHAAMPMISDASRQFIHEELDAFERQKPRLVKTLTTGLLAAAVARPMVSVTLAYMGGHAFDQLAWHAVVNWFTDLTAGAAGAAVGEAAAVQTGQIALVPLIRRLYGRLYQERTEALFNEMNGLVLGPILKRIDRFAAAADSADFRNAADAIDSLHHQGSGSFFGPLRQEPTIEP